MMPISTSYRIFARSSWQMTSPHCVKQLAVLLGRACSTLASPILLSANSRALFSHVQTPPFATVQFVGKNALLMSFDVWSKQVKY
jgi:hypothetical protein